VPGEKGQPRCYHGFHHISPFGEMGARRPFLLRGPNE
jgi:hypothetical protein